MKALILAAGLGSRLKHMTKELPKALTLVGDLPILGHQVNALRVNGIHQFVVVLGYQGQKIIDYFRSNYPDVEVSFVWNHEYNSSNSSYSFWQARELVAGDSYLHLNCDILFTNKLLKRLIASPEENVIAIRKDIALTDSMEKVILNGNQISKMSLKPLSGASGKAYGLAKLGRASTQFIIDRIQSYLSQGDRNQNYYGMIREAVETLPYYALDAGSEMLLEINTLEDFEIAQRVLSFQNQSKET